MQAEVSKALWKRCCENLCGPISSFSFHLWLHTQVQHTAWLGGSSVVSSGWLDWLNLLAQPLHYTWRSSILLSLQWRSWTRRLLSPAAVPVGQTRIQLILSPLLMNLSEQCALWLGSSACSWSLFRPSHQQIWREGGEWTTDAVFAIWVAPQSYCSGRGLGRRNTCLVSHILTRTVALWILLGASECFLSSILQKTQGLHRSRLRLSERGVQRS